MQKRLNQFMLLLTVLAVVMTSAISTTTVHADDGTTGEPTEPAGEESQPADESAPTETVEEILDLIPEGTELIVVSEAGVEPLASEAAAQILVESDPIWCPSTPGAGGCTGSFADFASLIAALEADAALVTPLYSGNGIIWVED